MNHSNGKKGGTWAQSIFIPACMPVFTPIPSIFFMNCFACTWMLEARLFVHACIHFRKSVKLGSCLSIKRVFKNICAYFKNIHIFSENIKKICLPSHSDRTHPSVGDISNPCPSFMTPLVGSSESGSVHVSRSHAESKPENLHEFPIDLGPHPALPNLQYNMRV